VGTTIFELLIGVTGIQKAGQVGLFVEQLYLGHRPYSQPYGSVRKLLSNSLTTCGPTVGETSVVRVLTLTEKSSRFLGSA
jgi:hypothetical protein